jgi:WD40 repeat protein
MELKIKSVIGFNGKVVGGLHYTPCGRYVVYSLGSFVVLKSLVNEREAFFDGHNQDVSCIAMSHNGDRLASGQVNFTGVKADVIVWDLGRAKALLEQGTVMVGEICLLHRLKQHLGRVQDVSFSNHDEFLASIGGQDDNALVIWNVESGDAICGSPAAMDSALTVRWLNNRHDRVVTAGNYHVRVWQVDFSLPKLHAMDTGLGSVRRVCLSIDITEDDHFAYIGTSTGDVLKVCIDRNEIMSYKDPDVQVPQLVGITKDRVSGGVKAICCVVNPATGNTNVLVGAGDGQLIFINPNMNRVAGYKTTLMGGITSITLHPKGQKFMVGTDQCNRYEVSKDLINAELKTSCHVSGVNDVAYPEGCPDLVVSSSRGDIRIWNIKSRQELLRIQVPNLECHCALVSPSGSSIVSGWDDGKIRAFYPESGRMRFVIPDAHTEKVTALAIADNDARSPWRIISGGDEGRVRVWHVTSSHQAMIVSLKEHRGPINCIKVNSDSTQCISASADGSCIIWDLNRYVRITALFEPTVFTSVLYHPDESQMLTCGANHKISYWDATDGQAIRVIDGGEDIMTTLDVTPSGEFFVSGSNDRLVKIWHYDDGLTVAVGRGHSGAVRSVKISPDQKTIVSVGSSGEIIFWEMPDLEAARHALLENL